MSMTERPTPSESNSYGSEPSLSPAVEAHPALSNPDKRALYEELQREDAKLTSPSSLAQMYLGALMTRSQLANPECLVQAAQSIRELMEKMPRYHGINPVQPI